MKIQIIEPKEYKLEQPLEYSNTEFRKGGDGGASTILFVTGDIVVAISDSVKSGSSKTVGGETGGVICGATAILSKGGGRRLFGVCTSSTSVSSDGKSASTIDSTEGSCGTTEVEPDGLETTCSPEKNISSILLKLDFRKGPSRLESRTISLNSSTNEEYVIRPSTKSFSMTI